MEWGAPRRDTAHALPRQPSQHHHQNGNVVESNLGHAAGLELRREHCGREHGYDAAAGVLQCEEDDDPGDENCPSWHGSLRTLRNGQINGRPALCANACGEWAVGEVFGCPTIPPRSQPAIRPCRQCAAPSVTLSPATDPRDVPVDRVPGNMRLSRRVVNRRNEAV